LLVCPFEVVKVRLQSELNIPLSMVFIYFI